MANDFLMDELNEKLTDYRYNMHAEDIAEFLGVCLSTVYKMANRDDFPKLQLPGSRLVVVPKPLFIAWYINNCCTAQKTNE